MRLEHREVATNGVRLHLVDAGPEDGTPLLFLHGFPEFWHGWRRQIPFFAAAGYRVLVPDQRGYNLSDKPRGLAAYRLHELAKDAVGLLDALDLGSAGLIGHDWGAAVAWWAAARFPDRFSKLAVLNVPHPAVMRRFLRSDRRQRRRSWYIFFFQLPWLPEYWYRRGNFAVGVRSLKGSSRRGTFSDEDVAAYRDAWSQPGALRAMIDWYRAAVRRPQKGVDEARIQIPTLLLWGERDIFLDRRTVEPSLEMCDDARLVAFPDATHWLQHEEADAVNETLDTFFSAGSVS